MQFLHGMGSKIKVIYCNYSLFKHAFKYGHVKSVISIEQLSQDYDDKLFHKATYWNHAMHHLLRCLKSSG